MKMSMEKSDWYDSDEDSPPPPEKIIYPELPLNSTWSLYFHEGYTDDWSEESYKLIYTVSTVQDFWRLMNNLPKFENYFLFFMRDNHPPLWEKKENAGTGWVYKIPKKGKKTLVYMTSMKKEKHPHGFNIFIEILISVIGEMICDDSERIIGVSLSPKTDSTCIRIWDTLKNKPLKFGRNFKVKDILNNKPHTKTHGKDN